MLLNHSFLIYQIQDILKKNPTLCSLKRGKILGTYPPEVRQFALSISFFSTGAYNQLRELLSKEIDLPHSKTISKWYQKVDTSPGITIQSLEMIKNHILVEREKGNEPIYSLMMDEIKIRASKIWDNSRKEFRGFVDFGTGPLQLSNDYDESLATDAFVFLINGVNCRFKVAVSYFLIKSLTAEERANIVTLVIKTIYDQCGARVIYLTFDGLRANLKMTTILGANIFSSPPKAFFNIEGVPYDIYLSLDNCHMLKLIRNNWRNYGVFYNSKDEQIEWRYLQMLHELQTEKFLCLAPKITSSHVYFDNMKMKVKLATQIFSCAVANSLKYLKKSNPSYINSNATSNFLQLFNDVFDILNSNNKFAKYQFKRALSSDNMAVIFDKLNEIEVYIEGLYYIDNFGEKIKLKDSTINTGFIGFLVNCNSLKKFYFEYVESNHMNYVLFYKMSQDHLELFFCMVRRMGGNNNNPNVINFEAAYKRLLVNKSIKSVNTGNCIAQDVTNILVVSSSSAQKFYNESILNTEDDDFQEVMDITDAYTLDVVTYIAGFIMYRAIKRYIHCIDCLEILSSGPKCHCDLIESKRWGNLLMPTIEVKNICISTEKMVKTCVGNSPTKFDYDRLTTKILQSLDPTILSSQSMLDHCKEFTDISCLDSILYNHRYIVLKLVISLYLKIRFHFMGKKENSKKISIRKKLNKIILFNE